MTLLKASRNIYGTGQPVASGDPLAGSGTAAGAAGPGPLRVLDAGGGEGANGHRRATGHHVTLCDLSAEMVARARRGRKPIKV